MRAEGAAVMAVAAFGLSFVAGMQAGSGTVAPPKTPVGAAAAQPLSLATAEALPAIAAEPAKPVEQAEKRKPKPKKTTKRKPVVRAPAPAPAPVVQAAPAPPPAAAPAPVVTATPKPQRTPTPVPTFDDGGEPNSGEFENGGTP